MREIYERHQSVPLAFRSPITLDLKEALQRVSSMADWVSLRLISETTQYRSIRNDKPEANEITLDQGLMVEVLVDGQLGYAGTCELTLEGIVSATHRAVELAKATASLRIMDYSLDLRPSSRGSYRSSVGKPFDTMSVQQLDELLRETNQRMKISDLITNRLSQVMLLEAHHQMVSSSGLEIDQQYVMVGTNFEAIASQGSMTQRRAMNGREARCFQGGLELLDRHWLLDACEQVAKEAIELLHAPNCPAGQMDLILDPDQMMLQIHESIGHPLEMDRILGDERNFAGWSFVRPEDFGKLQYGSELMNVSFDPHYQTEFAGYAYDDSGLAAEKKYLIRQGLLERGLGGLESQVRMQKSGVANFRAAGWNRAPIDRMANINLEPGQSKLVEMISKTEKGIYMRSNVSWSIDDYRDNFQFGCEWGQLIENGKLGQVVKNPNYRGRTLTFWHSLAEVGSADEMQCFGTPWCGKGEPSQVIRVGHASPPCRFTGIEVFGGSR